MSRAQNTLFSHGVALPPLAMYLEMYMEMYLAMYLEMYVEM